MTRLRKGFICFFAYIYLFVLFTGCSNFEHNSNEEQLITFKGDRTARLMSYRNMDYGFLFTPDERMSSYSNTYYARKFYKKTMPEAPMDNLPVYISEEYIEDMDIWELLWWTGCANETIKKDRSLLKAVKNNSSLKSILKFEPGGTLGILLIFIMPLLFVRA